jgi:hypothetical protein
VREPIRIDPSSEPFQSTPRLISQATRLFSSSLAWLSIVTLVVSLPGKFFVQLLLSAFELPAEGAAAYLITYATDLVWSALLAATVLHGLGAKLRSGKLPPWQTSLAWGWRAWGTMLKNVFKVEITVVLWGLLLIVPGIIAMIRLILTEPIVAIEGPGPPDPLRRSRELTEGRVWRVALALAPLVPIGIVQMYAVFRSLQISPFLMAAVDSVLTILDQWGAAAALLIYLGVAPPSQPAQKRSQR